MTSAPGQPEVVVVSTGVANTASMRAALERCGADVVISDEPSAVQNAGCVVLPGVGSFTAGMQTLRNHGLGGVLRERVLAGRPTLAVCLGLQLLCARSEESPGVEGLGVIDAPVEAFVSGVRVPQFGWNRVEAGPGCRLIESGHAYYANSFRLTRAPEGWSCATTTHGERFIAALERGPVLACQFHPELSGPWGLALIGRWLASAREGVAC